MIDALGSAATIVAPTSTEPADPADLPRRAPRYHRLSVYAAVAALYLGLAVLVMGHFVGAPNERISSHLPPDNSWFEWLLSHALYSFRHGTNPFFSTRQNFPFGVNMMANTSVLGITLPLAPVTMWLGPRVAYVIWLILACAGTAASTCWVLRRYLVRSRVAAIVGGAFAGFAPGVIHHANGQPNFVSNFVLPLIVASALRLGAGRRWLRDGVVLGLLVTYQVFINEELLLITAVGCVVAVLARSAFRPRDARARAGRFFGGLAAGMLVSGVLLAYPLWFQFNGPGSYRGVPYYTNWGEDLNAYVIFARDTIAGTGSTEHTIGRTEQNSWYGWPLTIVFVLLVILMFRRSLAVRVAAVVALVLGTLSLGPVLRFAGVVTGIPGPLGRVDGNVPLLNLVTPSRFTFAVTAAIVVVLAVSWDQWASTEAQARRFGRWHSLAGHVSIAAALLPLIPTPLPAKEDPLPPAFLVSGAWRNYVPDGRSLVPLPLPSRKVGQVSVDWSAFGEHEWAVPEGYFLGPATDGTGKFGPPLNSKTSSLVYAALAKGTVPTVSAAARVEVRDDLVRWRAAVVLLPVAGTDVGHTALLQLATALYGPPQQVMDVWLWDVRTMPPVSAN